MADNLWEGDIFAGKYRVERVIGQGAMGMVIAARHLGLDEPVAIKVLLPEMREIPGMVDRFIREARAAARIRGDNVVRVSDVDTLPSGVPFMVMERLEGSDLAELIRTRAPLGVGEVARHAREVCVALADAHAAGIVHRDIKPGNLPPGSMTQQSLTSSAAFPPAKKGPLGPIMGVAAVLAVAGAGIFFAARPARSVPVPAAAAPAPVVVEVAPAATAATPAATAPAVTPAPEAATATPTVTPAASADAPTGGPRPSGKRGAQGATSKPSAPAVPKPPPAAPAADPFAGDRR